MNPATDVPTVTPFRVADSAWYVTVCAAATPTKNRLRMVEKRMVKLA